MNPEVFNQLVREKAQMVEACLIACIEGIEDRAPTHEEVALFSRREVFERREEFFWKERMIVRVDYWPAPTMPYAIFSLVNPFNPVPQ